MKIYTRKLSPSALQTFGHILSLANVDAIIERDRDKIDDIQELLSLYVAVSCGDPSATEWQD